jgi:hypothetical protein
MARSRLLEHHRLRRRQKYPSIPVGGLPLAPAEIPICWLSQPLSLRLERPLNLAEVTQLDASTARSRDQASIAAYQVFPFTATLSTAVDADPANLAHWTVTYNASPRTRAPRLLINLIHRSEADKAYILGLTRGRRIRLMDIPPEFPAGADHLVIAGVTHVAGEFTRYVEWTTSPVIGSAPGVAGPWFRWGTSAWSGTDVRPF